jgi:signal peptidase II
VKRLLGVSVILLVAAMDLGTKAWARSGLHEAQPYELLPFFDLTLGFNRGVSFGLFAASASPWPVIFITAVGTAIFAAWFWRTARSGEQLALALIVGGALGNLVDRLQRGAVTDFLDLHAAGRHWPAFNLADTAIVSGAALLLWCALSARKQTST